MSFSTRPRCSTLKRNLLVIALLCQLILEARAQTQNAQDVPPLVVTATRFDSRDSKIPANITILSREDIRQLPAAHLPDVLKAVAGISSRALYGALGTDSTIDMRGFGATASNNTLILLDGMRLNPVDAGSLIWSSIPLDQVERIEIMRGSGTVLYGDGASGGVINIITRKSATPQVQLKAEVGSYRYQALGAELANSNERGYFRLVSRSALTEGYRQNNQQDERNISGRTGLFLPAGELFADYAIYKESAGQPGSRLSAEYAQDPRGSSTPTNTQTRDGYRLRPGINYHLRPHLSIEGEIGVDEQNLNSRYVSSNFMSDRMRKTFSITPRIRWRHDLGALNSETIFGLDYYDSEVRANNQGGPNQEASQTSSAAYLQNTTGLTERLNLTLGAREQRMKQSAQQAAYDPWFSPAVSGYTTRHQTAWDVGLNYTTQHGRLYAKTGTTFRFANTDELFGFDAFGTPIFSGNLRPQHGNINEIGAQISSTRTSLRASIYQLDLKDEIAYDSALSANTNLAPTRRQGLELEADWQLMPNIKLKTGYTHTHAKFRDGDYKDAAIPLVARHQAHMQAIWEGQSYGTWSALIRHTGQRRYDSDFANTQGMIDRYTTLDLQATWQFKPWQLNLKLLNVGDVKYADYAGYSAFRNDTYYYPANGRAFYLTGRYDF